MKIIALYVLACVCVSISAFSSTQKAIRGDVTLAIADKDSDLMRWARSARSAGRYVSEMKKMYQPALCPLIFRVPSLSIIYFGSANISFPHHTTVIASAVDI